MLQFDRSTLVRAARPPDCVDCAITSDVSAGLTTEAAAPQVRPTALLAQAVVLVSSAARVAASTSLNGGGFWIAVLVVVPVAIVLLLALTLSINMSGSAEGGHSSTGAAPESAEEFSHKPPPPATAQRGVAKWVGASGVVATRARLQVDDGSPEGSISSLSTSTHGAGLHDGPLCPAMLVPPGGGASLVITSPALIIPGPQCIVASVSSMDKGLGPSGAVARLFFSETGKKGGILLEAGHQFPIAYIDSGSLVRHSDGIRIHRVCDRSMHPYCVVKAASHSGHFEVFHADPAGSASGPILHVQVPVTTPGASEVRAANVTDAQGQLLATMERPSPKPGEDAVKYYIHFGLAHTDGALVVLALVTAMKLGCIASATSGASGRVDA